MVRAALCLSDQNYSRVERKIAKNLSCNQFKFLLSSKEKGGFMKNIFTLLFTITISFSCWAFTSQTEIAKSRVQQAFLDTTVKQMENYYKNKNCSNAINIMKKSASNDLELGFVLGIYDDDLSCLKNQTQETLRQIHLEAACFGLGCLENNTGVDLFLQGSQKIKVDFTETIEGLMVLTGYYYATRDKRILEVMKSVILSAKKKEWCYPKEKPIVDGDECPPEGALEDDKKMLAEVEERLKKRKNDGDINARKYLLEEIEKAKSKRCILAWKYSHCPNQETLYFAAEFLKHYDISWYSQNVKNWLAEKEKIFLEWERKEAEESAKRIAENERKRAERKKADDELRKIGVDLDGDPNKIGIIMYNPKTGKTQKF